MMWLTMASFMQLFLLLRNFRHSVDAPGRQFE